MGNLDKTRNEISAKSPTEEQRSILLEGLWEEPELALMLRLVSLSTHLRYLLLHS